MIYLPKRVVPLLLVLSLSFWDNTSLQAQANLDSLWTIWNDTNQPDTTRLQAMYDICDDRARSEWDSVLSWTDKMHLLASDKGLKKYQAGALFQKGRVYSYKRDLQLTEKYYQESLGLYEEIGYQFGVLRVLSYTAGLKYNQRLYEEAISICERVISLAEEMNDKFLVAGVSKVHGHSYNELGNLPKASQIYNQGLVFSAESGDRESEAWFFHAIADIFAAQGDSIKSVEYHKNSEIIYREINDKQGLIHNVTHMGFINSARGNYEQAIENFNEVREFFEAQNTTVPAHIFIGFANTYLWMKNYPEARAMLENAENSNQRTEDILIEGDIFYFRSLLYQAEGKYIEAINLAKRSLEIYEQVRVIQKQRDANHLLYELYKQINNRDLALSYYENSYLLNDSLKNIEASKKLQQAEYRRQIVQDSLEEEQVKLRMEMLHQQEMSEEQSRKNIFMFSGIGILLIAGGLWSRLRYVRKSRAAIKIEKDRSENLLLNILPAEVAEELKTYGKAKARDFDTVSIIFTDFKGFTETSEQLTAAELVEEINSCFEAFDKILEEYSVEKIKTIGDAYMAAGGLPVSNPDSVSNTVLAALEMNQFIINRKKERDSQGLIAFEMRCGIHTGPVVAGIVGVKKFQYDIWGDTVNTASRLESSGEPGKVNISEDTYQLIKDEPGFSFTKRGEIDVKGKGRMNMYFVERESG